MHNHSRRHFLTSLSALGIVGLVGKGDVGTDVTSTDAPSTIDLARVTCAEFAACLGSAFRLVPSDASPVEVELVRARELRPGRGQSRTPFSLIFRGDGPDRLPQQTCRVEHARLGAFRLFIVPITPVGEAPRYQAIFG